MASTASAVSASGSAISGAFNYRIFINAAQIRVARSSTGSKSVAKFSLSQDDCGIKFPRNHKVRRTAISNAFSNSYLSSNSPMSANFFLANSTTTLCAVEDGNRATEEDTLQSSSSELGLVGLVGEDSATFVLDNEKKESWINFCIVLGVVMTVLYFVWLEPENGLGTPYAHMFESLTDSRELQMFAMLFVFALVHSGGAALRSSAEKVIGERAYRVLFAGLSLPLAVSAVVFFINHRYDGVQLWQFRTIPGMHELVWFLSFVSFFFLYPSTFNLLEVAAVDKPKVHLWETGVMRITRHPQLFGQFIWCVAHTLWIGNSFTLVTSLALLSHHAFGAWHGDQRLASKFGESFQIVKARTSVVPFAAIFDGRQQLPDDYWKEFARVPYYVIVGFTIGAYLFHPIMQQASFWLHW